MLALPRRRLDVKDAERIAADVTAWAALAPGVALRGWQGVALKEIFECRGAYLGLPVGTGKTLISWLAPSVLDAKRPLLLVPASLREKTLVDFRSFGSWRAPPAPMLIRSYEEMTRLENLELLKRIDPDLIFLDECDVLLRHDASAVRRLGRYVGDYEPIVIAATGTPGRLSILDYAHLLIWCLKAGAPVPTIPAELELWASVLDEKKVGPRAKVGALALLGGDGTTVAAREAYSRRLVETPGVVIVDEDSCDQPLSIELVPAPEDPILDEHFIRFREEWITPDGWPLSDPLSVYRHAGELGTGMFYRWDPRPPEWWLGPRRVFCKFVRDRIVQTTHAHKPLDTELAVRRAHADHPIITTWKATEPKFEPNSVPVWLSGSLLEWCADQAVNGPPTLVWCGTRAFAEALAYVSGLKYYGAKGMADDGSSIDRAPAELSAIVSIGANKRGRNLQRFRENLVVNPPQSARYLEQVIGRTHRAGQTGPVRVRVVCSSGDIQDAFEAAIREARFGASTHTIRNKILRARIDRATVPIRGNNWARWARRSSTQEA